MTIERVRDAIVILHWKALSEKPKDEAWIQALCDAARTVKKLRSKAA